MMKKNAKLSLVLASAAMFFMPYGCGAQESPSLSEKQRSAIQSIINSTFPENTKKEEVKHQLREGGVYFFVSRSLEEQTLISIYESMSKNMEAGKKVMAVFQGVDPEVKTVDGTSRSLQKVIKDILPVPTSVIDSRIFSEGQIDRVPAMAKRVGDRVFVAYGIFGLEHFERALELRMQGLKDSDKGVIELSVPQSVATKPMNEIPFTEDLKQRASKVDWDKKAKDAKTRMWSRMPSTILPAATETKERLVDISLIATKTYTHPQTGEILVQAGQKINPAKEKRFGRAIIIFDGVSQTQEDIAIEEVEKAKKQGLLPIVMSTRLAEKNPEQHYLRLSKRFNSKVFLLTDGIKDRFEIQKVPSVVTQEGELMKVKEIEVSVAK